MIQNYSEFFIVAVCAILLALSHAGIAYFVLRIYMTGIQWGRHTSYQEVKSVAPTVPSMAPVPPNGVIVHPVAGPDNPDPKTTSPLADRIGVFEEPQV